MDPAVDSDGRAVLEPAAGDVPLVAISARGSRQPQDSASPLPASVTKMNHLTSVPGFLLNVLGSRAVGSQAEAGSPGTPCASSPGSGINRSLYHYVLGSFVVLRQVLLYAP